MLAEVKPVQEGSSLFSVTSTVNKSLSGMEVELVEAEDTLISSKAGETKCF